MSPDPLVREHGEELPADGRYRPYLGLVGIKVVSMSEGTSTVVLPMADRLLNGVGGMHGGAVASLLDVAVTMAGRAVSPSIESVLTVSMAINFIAPCKNDLRAEGRVVRSGRTLIAAEASVFDEDGAVVASAIATLRPKYRE